MKIIFLDIDGVLNSAHWWDVRPPAGEYESEEVHAFRNIDPAAVARLNTIIGKSGAVIVLSSTWRTMYTLSYMQRLLNRKGFAGRLFACTPCHASAPNPLDDQGNTLYIRRGTEIQAWLDMLGPGRQPDSFVILDDDADMAHLSDSLVRTHFSKGLLDEHVIAALEVLNQ